MLEKTELLRVPLGSVGYFVGGNVKWVCGRDLKGNLLSKLPEIVRACHEVGFTIDFDKRPEATVVVYVRMDNALGRGPFGAFGGGLEALLP